MNRAPVVLLALALTAGCRVQQFQRISGLTMGTTYSITLRVPSRERLALVRKAVDGELDAVNRMMSMFIPDSEISRFNAHSSREWFAVSEPLFRLLETARAVSEKSGGAFDVTVKPLVDLWGFGTKRRRSSPPPPEEIAAARGRIGYRKLVLHSEKNMIRKEQEDLEVDLSAIAKGFGVDLVARRLRGMGISDFLVEIGGEVRASGSNPRSAPWKVAISDPSRRGFRRVVALSGRAIATSGSYENYFEWQGRAYSHTVDPASGWPIGPETVSVSVIAATCMEADAWATACDVLGAEKSLALAEREGLAIYLVLRSQKAGGYSDRVSDLFKGFFPK